MSIPTHSIKDVYKYFSARCLCSLDLCFVAVSFSLLTLQSRCFVARNTNSSRSQKRLGRRCQKKLDGIYALSYFPPRPIKSLHRVESHLLLSPSFAVKTRALRKSPALRCIVCRDSLIQFSCSLFLPLPFSEISFPSVFFA